MELQLRKNQTEAIDKAIRFFRSPNQPPSLIVLPTAWGKSILTAYVAKYTDDKIIILQPSKELLEQNFSKYQTLCGGIGAKSGVFSASFGRKEGFPVTYATIGSIVRYGAEFKRLGFTKMLIDEAHLYPREADSMLGRFIKESGITHVLGITATPLKLQSYGFGKKKFSKLVMLTSMSSKGNFFRNIIHVGQVQEMVEYGYWSKLLYKEMHFDGSGLRYNSNRSDYTDGTVQRAYDSNGVERSIIATLDAHPERRHVLVFVPSVNDAVRLSRVYPSSAVVYGTMDKKERADVIDAFRAGKIRVLFNVRVLSTGFDYTGIDCIVLGISTSSIALYYQILGRGTRIAEGKKNCLVVDLGGNFSRFGFIEDITFEQGRIWRMFGTGGRLLSGIPIHEIGKYTRKDVIEEDRNSGTVAWRKNKQ